MRALLAPERRGLAATSVLLLGTVAVTMVFVIEQRGLHRGLALVAGGTVFVIWIQRLTRWRNLVSALLIVILFIPIGRYSLPGNLPFNLDLEEFNQYATMQFMKRMERISKSRGQTLEEINNVANSMDEEFA